MATKFGNFSKKESVADLDYFVGYDPATGSYIRATRDDLLGDATIQNTGVKPFATKTDMDAFTPGTDDPTVAIVMNDSTASNNGWYRYDSGTTSWVKRDEFYATDPAVDDDTTTGKAAAPKWVGDYLDGRITDNLDPEDVSKAVDGKAVADYIEQHTIPTGNIADPSKIEAGNVVSDGGFYATAGWQRIVNIPVFKGHNVTISGIRPGTSKYIAWYSEKNGNGFISVEGSVTGIMTITPPAGAHYLALSIKTPNETTDQAYQDSMMIEHSSSASEYIPFSTGRYLDRIFGKPILATKFPAGIEKSDLTIEQSSNLLNPDLVIDGIYINSIGDITNGPDWKTIKLPVDSGKYYTFGRINISTGHWAFYRETVGKKILISNGSFTSNQTKTLQAPEGVSYLYITLVRSPNDTIEQDTINEGQALLPYETYFTPYIKEIDGNEIRGQDNTFNQDLNTFSQVKFAFAELGGLKLTLPTGSGSPPAEVGSGEAWIDSANGNVIKVKA